MNHGIRLCIVGAGSSYTPELIRGIIGLDPMELPITSINMHDIDARRLDIMAGLSARMLKAAGKKIHVTSCPTLPESLTDVDFVVTQIRVGGMAARILDEKIPMKYGIIGQETTGPGGMFKALRTIPRMLEVADAVAKFAPDAFILNYTNPSGIITEAVTKHSQAKIIGLCSGIPCMQRDLKKDLGDTFPDISSRCIGLNHLGFIHRIFAGGTDVTREAIERHLALEPTGDDNAKRISNELARVIQAIPIGYVNYYFRRAMKIAELRAEPETRGEKVMKIESGILAQAAMTDAADFPSDLEKRGGGGYAEVTFDCMRAIWNDSGAAIACSVPNHGAVDGIDEDAVVEIVCRIGRQGATPLPVGTIPSAFRGLVQAVKSYETLTVQAAVTKDINHVYHALLNHPLVGDWDVIVPLVDEMMTAHQLNFR
jgi:6-phospho-beta-glucosidase